MGNFFPKAVAEKRRADDRATRLKLVSSDVERTRVHAESARACSDPRAFATIHQCRRESAASLVSIDGASREQEAASRLREIIDSSANIWFPQIAPPRTTEPAVGSRSRLIPQTYQ